METVCIRSIMWSCKSSFAISFSSSSHVSHLVQCISTAETLFSCSDHFKIMRWFLLMELKLLEKPQREQKHMEARNVFFVQWSIFPPLKNPCQSTVNLCSSSSITVYYWTASAVSAGWKMQRLSQLCTAHWYLNRDHFWLGFFPLKEFSGDEEKPLVILLPAGDNVSNTACFKV